MATSSAAGSGGPPRAPDQPSSREALPLLNRLADFCVVYGVDHQSFQKSNEPRNRFSSFLNWAQEDKTGEDKTEFRLEPQLLGVIAPQAGYFPYETNALGDYPHLEAMEDFKEKQIGVSRDRVFTLQHVIFPDGAHICLEARKPLVISARLTDYEGNKTYCTSLTFYRKYRVGHTRLEPCTTADVELCVFAPVSITLVSQTPRYRTQSELLTCVYERVCVDPFKGFWKQVAEFAQRIFVVPTPPPGSLQTCFNMYGEHVWKLNPYHPCAPHGSSSELDIRLHYPFLCLSPENVLKVIAAILFEKRIIFSSSHYSMLTFVIECFFHYISPLEWRYTVITTVASSLLELLEYFGVYLYGIHSDLLADPMVKAVQDVVWVDLDKGTVVGDLADGQPLPSIPQEAAEAFLQRYDAIQENFDVLMTEHPAFLRTEDLVTARATFEAEYDQQLSSAFLDLMVDLLGHMFLFRLGGGTDIKLWKEFTHVHDKDRLFYEEVWKGDMWSNLIYQRGPKTVRDMFTIKVEAFKRSASRQASTDSLQSKRHSLRGLFGTLSEDLMSPTEQTEQSCTSRTTAMLSSFHSSLSNSSLPSSMSKAVTGHMLCLPDYKPQKDQYFSSVLDAITTLLENEHLPDAVLAPLFYLEGCYRVTCRELTRALDCFYKTDKYMVAVGLKPSKQMLKFIVQRMTKCEATTFRDKPYYYECHKVIEDQQAYLRGVETPIEARQKLPKDPITQEGCAALLKKHNITRDSDTAHKLFSVLSKHYSTIQPDVFREFYDNWKEHTDRIKSFQLPDFKLQAKGQWPERVLMTYCEQNCQTSAGNGHLVLTTFRLLVVVKGGTRTQCLLDLREPVMLEKFDMRHLLSSFPAITQRSNEDKQPGSRKQSKLEWFAGFPESYVRDMWYRMLKELMFAIRECGKRKSPEKIGLAETSIFVTNAVLHCSQFQSKQREEHRVNRVISKLQHFANKDVSEIKPTKPVQGLQYTLNPSLDEPRGRQTIECAVYVPPAVGEGGQGKLWLGLGNGLLKVYDLETRSPESDVKVVDSYHRKTARLSCMLLVGDCVWACSLNKTIHILSAETCCVNHRLSHLEDDICDLTLDKDNNVVWSLFLIQCKVIAWNPVTREPIKKIEVQNGIQCKCIVVHKKQLWIGTKNGLFVIDREDGAQLAHITEEKQPLDVKFLAISSMQEIWCGTEPNRDAFPLVVYDPNNFEKRHTFSELRDEWVNVILATSNKIWCGTKSGKIHIVDAVSYQRDAVLDAHTDRVRTMISTGGEVISGSASKDGTAAIWEAERTWLD